jgi:hypothetical protein
MDQQQMKKILVPALAIAALVLLVGVIVSVGGDNGPIQNSKTTTPPPVTPGKREIGTVPINADGMATAIPSKDAPEWKTVANGLKIWDVKEGTDGEPAESTDTVLMHYTGWLLDGTVFDNSVAKNSPLNMPLSNLIAGWQRGIPGMKPGGIRRLFIPSELGYGSRGAGASIPPNSDLIFEVKLLRLYR